MLGLSFFLPVAFGATYYAAPTGRSTNTGTAASPLDIFTAIGKTSPARPGDTVCLAAGKYVAPSSSSYFFRVYLTGAANNYITISSCGRHRVTLDGGMEVYNQWVIVRDLEFMSSFTNRVTSVAGSNPPDILQPAGVSSFAPNVKMINNIVHDLSSGMASWRQAHSNEFYGNIVFYNGHKGPDRGHGHGFYMQNQGATKYLYDNVIFSNFEIGMQIYGTSTTFIENFHLEGNTVFNNGVMSGRYSRNLLVGGTAVAVNPVILNNSTYYPTGWNHGGDNNIGYYASGAGCTNLRMDNNYLVSGGLALTQWRCTIQSMAGNTLFGELRADAVNRRAGNTYLDRVRPTSNRVFVRPNRYEAGRANITVYNWTRSTSVPADISAAGLAVGDAYEVFDVQNIFGSPVATGVYSGAPISLPMNLVAVTPAVGNAPYPPVHTDMEYNVFLLRKVSGSAGTPPPPPPPAPVAVSDVSASQLTSTGAVIGWSTNVPATSRVTYGVGNAAASSTQATSSSQTFHSVQLSGLQPATTYLYQAVSVDQNGLSASSSVLSFTTPPASAVAPLAVSALAVTQIASDSAVVTWATNRAANSSVGYGTASPSASQTPVTSTTQTSHSVRLSGLLPSTTYSIEARSAETTGGTATGRMSFTTAPASSGNTGSLTISSIAPVSVTSRTATITWTTNVAATSQVLIGTASPSENATALTSTRQLSHSVPLTGLAPGTTYVYQVRSRNDAGVIATSATMTLTTLGLTTPAPPAAPVISGLTVSTVTSSSALVRWSTNIPATSQLTYGLTGTEITTALSTALNTSHSVQLTGLTASTRYLVAPRSTASGLTSVPVNPAIFTTLAASTPPPPPPPPPATGSTVIVLEAEDGVTAGGMTFPFMSPTSRGRVTKSTTANTSTVTFTFLVERTGTFYLWTRVLASQASNGTYAVSVDGASEDIYDALYNNWSPDWKWDMVSARAGGAPRQINKRAFSLNRGWHKITFRSLDPGTLLDTILITDDAQLTATDRFANIR